VARYATSSTADPTTSSKTRSSTRSCVRPPTQPPPRRPGCGAPQFGVPICHECSDEEPRRPERVLNHLLSAVPGLGRDAAAAALRQAKADHWSSLARLAADFRDRPHALAQWDFQAPLVRLAHALRSAGYRGVAAPRCADCGRLTDKLVILGPAGRICGTCKSRRHHAPCVRCGQRRRIYARRADGGICGLCYTADPARKEPCGQCGKACRPPFAGVGFGQSYCGCTEGRCAGCSCCAAGAPRRGARCESGSDCRPLRHSAGMARAAGAMVGDLDG
jgi:hypothetical protein